MMTMNNTGDDDTDGDDEERHWWRRRRMTLVRIINKARLRITITKKLCFSHCCAGDWSVSAVTWGLAGCQVPVQCTVMKLLQVHRRQLWPGDNSWPRCCSVISGVLLSTHRQLWPGDNSWPSCGSVISGVLLHVRSLPAVQCSETWLAIRRLNHHSRHLNPALTLLTFTWWCLCRKLLRYNKSVGVKRLESLKELYQFLFNSYINSCYYSSLWYRPDITVRVHWA